MRSKPSTSKIHFLMHLENCRATAYSAITDCLQVCDDIRLWTNLQPNSVTWWDGGKAFDERFDVIQKDIQFLQKLLQEKETECDEIRKLLHEQVNLVQTRRLFLTTVIAGLYIPLSFTTSVFGMNMVPISDASRLSTEKSIDTQVEGLSADWKNSTSAIISAIGTSGNMNYKWSTFIATAVCLMTTLPAAIVIDSIVRRSIRAWPVLVAAVVLVCIYVPLGLVASGSQNLH